MLHLSLPFGILYADISGLRSIRLPWGEQIVVARGTPHPLQLINHPFYPTMFAFFGYALVRQYRGGSRRRGLVLGLALTPLLVARVVDPLVVLGVIDSILTSELAFLGIVIAMSLVLSHEITQTERALQTYEQHLQELVAERTAGLSRANDRLAQEVHERMLLEGALQRRVDELTALKQVADIGIRVHNLTAALQAMCDIATSLLAVCSAYIIIPSNQEADLHILVGYEYGAGPLDSIPLDVALADLPFTNQVLTHGRSLIVPALQAHTLPPAIREIITRQQLQCSMLIPLVIRGTVTGVMVVATDQVGRTFTSDEMSLAETIAGDISAAIDNMRLYQRAVAARERLTTLYQASQAISQASLDPQQIYTELHAAVARLMPTEAFVITLFDEADHEADDVYLSDKDGR